MSAIPLKLPFGRMFNQAGNAGTRRLLMIGGATIIGLGAVAGVTLHNRSADPRTVIAKVPAIDPLPGGPHSTPVYSDLAVRADQDRSAKAAAQRQSSVATMPGSETAVAVPPPPAQTIPITPPAAVASRPVPAAPVRAEPPSSRQVAQATPAQTRSDGNNNQTNAYQAAISSLLAGWGDKPQVTEVILRPDDAVPGSDAGSAGRPDSRSRSAEPAASAAPVPLARSIGDRAGGRVLMPAGRGVYARTVLAASSDQGGPVVVEALSGPIVGNRMTGSFQQRDTRLVIHLESITLRDGTQQKIDALVIAPDTLETSVASSVDQHYVSRYVLPVAAAFVSGLGQALAQSNSTVVAGPFGGATAFQRLNLGQQLGVAAGAAANQFGAAVTANAPRGPTVNVDANVNVGVVFLSPLIVGGDR